MKIRCPKCGDSDPVHNDRVIDSRQTGDGRAVRRRRVCGKCGGRYTTYEVAVEGAREPTAEELVENLVGLA